MHEGRVQLERFGSGRNDDNECPGSGLELDNQHCIIKDCLLCETKPL